ncbi:tripartite tricarboxylate transporter substrate binding protein [Xylophilus sp. GW821-FHT01B05]
MHSTYRRSILAAACAATALIASGAALAQGGAYPDKPVTIIAPFPPGGSTDIMARLLAAELQPLLGQTFLVDNKGGANGGIGTAQAAKAAPDGYTLLISGVGSNAINYGLYPKLPYADKDFIHISLLATGPNVIVAHPSFAAKSLAELVRMAKAAPGTIQAANSGNGSSNHLSMHMLEQAAGFKMVSVSYKGGAPAINDAVAGHVPILTLNQDVLLPFVKAGKLRPLAVTSEKRNPAYPDVPTVAEQGYPGFAAESWFGLSAPAGTPQAVIDKLSAATIKAMASPRIREKLEAVGFVVVGGTPAQANAFVKNEITKWSETVKTSGATVE